MPVDGNNAPCEWQAQQMTFHAAQELAAQMAADIPPPSSADTNGNGAPEQEAHAAAEEAGPAVQPNGTL